MVLQNMALEEEKEAERWGKSRLRWKEKGIDGMKPLTSGRSKLVAAAVATRIIRREMIFIVIDRVVS